MSNDRLIDSLWEQLIKARADNVRLEVAHERFYQEIMRLREKFNAGKELRQERLPVLAPVGLLKLWLEIG